jgi:DNA mismatch repair ATPase MutS
VAGLVCWAVWDWPWFALFASLHNFFYYLRLQGRIEQAANPVEKASADLKLLAELLALLEIGKFSSPKLLQIQAQMRGEGIAPSTAIRKLARIAEYLQSRRNQFARVFDLFTFWSAQLVFAAERWQREFGSSIRGWLDAVGQFEALTALAGFAYEHPEYVFPEFADQGPLFEAEGFAHPLLPDHNAVTNNLRLGDGLQLILLSGPNMAGKSTFIRGVGVSAVLAQCGAPVRARRLRLSPLQVGASICVLDSLSGGMSRFYAEIHRVKLICDLTLDSAPAAPVLFLLDELLSGTNSQDRLEGTRLVLESLLERDAVGIVSTHDLALTQIPDALGARAVNCHFEDRLENEELIFDYRLKPGIVQTSNALKLMRSIGLGGLGTAKSAQKQRKSQADRARTTPKTIRK